MSEGTIQVAVVAQVSPLMVRPKGKTTDVDVQHAIAPVPEDLAVGERVLIAFADRQVQFLGRRLPVETVVPILPVGAITEYAGTAAPVGWLLCDGSDVPRIMYPSLFDVIGATYGPGDGATTFTLPDLRGRGPIGPGLADVSNPTERFLGEKLGDERHVLSTSELPTHSHGDAGAHRHEPNPGGQFVVNRYPTTISGNVASGSSAHVTADGEGQTSSSGEHRHANVGLNHGHNNMQPSIVLHFIIRSGA